MNIMKILFPSTFGGFIASCIGSCIGCVLVYLLTGDFVEVFRVEIQTLAIFAAGTTTNITHQEE